MIPVLFEVYKQSQVAENHPLELYLSLFVKNKIIKEDLYNSISIQYMAH